MVLASAIHTLRTPSWTFFLLQHMFSTAKLALLRVSNRVVRLVPLRCFETGVTLFQLVDFFTFCAQNRLQLLYPWHSQSNPIELNLNRTQTNSTELNPWIVFEGLALCVGLPVLVYTNLVCSQTNSSSISFDCRTFD